MNGGCALTGLTDIDAILSLPSLTKLSVSNIASSDEKSAWQRVVDAHAARASSASRR